MKRIRYNAGFTLIELMIAVAILGIIVAIAIPAYTGYIDRARYGAARANVEPLRIAVEDYFMENGSYAAAANKAAINTTYGWTPEGDEGAFQYKIDVPGAGGEPFSITVTHIASGKGVTCPKGQACTEF